MDYELTGQKERNANGSAKNSQVLILLKPSQKLHFGFWPTNILCEYVPFLALSDGRNVASGCYDLK